MKDHRGKLPDIRAEDDTITFFLTISLSLKNHIGPQLVLRCERDGEIYVSIHSEHQAMERHRP